MKSIVFCIFYSVVLCISVKMPAEPPRIIEQLTTSKILFKVGNPNVTEEQQLVVLSCEAEGEPAPTYKWTKNGEDFDWTIRAINRMYQRTGSGTLLIVEPQDEDAGWYQCFARNEFGTATANPVLVEPLDNQNSVFRKMELQNASPSLVVPHFTIEPEALTTTEDERVEFKCEASGEPKPQIAWINNGRLISEAPCNLRRKITSKSIIIEKVIKNDTGNYGCNATNSFGYVYKDFYLNVLTLAPEILQPPINTIVTDNNNVTLTCRVSGVPKPNVKWTKDEKELPTRTKAYRILKNGDLKIRNAMFYMKGEYTCHASNEVGEAQATAFLTVVEATTITAQTTVINAVAGSTAILTCEATTDHEIIMTSVEWLRNGQTIDFDAEGPRIFHSEGTLKYNEPDGYYFRTYSLIITNVRLSDCKNYTCVAKTKADESAAHMNLQVQGIPDVPRLKSVTCGPIEANVIWTSTASDSLVLVQYNTSFDPDKWTSARHERDANVRKCKIPLSPWGNYTFRLVAFNEAGQSQPSAISNKVCTTGADVPYKNPDDVKARGDEPWTLTITWKPMPQIEHNSPGFKYKVHYKRDLPNEEWTVRDVRDWKRSFLRVEDQPTYQRYRIKVQAVNDMGPCSAEPLEVIGYSGEDLPVLAPANFTVLQIVSGESALLSWSPVPEITARGELWGYDIHTWTKNDEGEVTRTGFRVKGGNETSALVDVLVPYTRNYIEIVACNLRYCGPASKVLSVDMPEGVPGPVKDFNAYPETVRTPVGQISVQLKWSKPSKINGVLTGYIITYQKYQLVPVLSGMEPNIDGQLRITDPEATSTEITSLMPKIRYLISICAMTNAGPGEVTYLLV